MKHFHFSCQGESHKTTNKPCQDFSASYLEKDLTIAVVCDGHGGERYFRSDIGSRICTDITIEAIKQFVVTIYECDQRDQHPFINKPFTQRGIVADSQNLDKVTNADYALRQLFASIVASWNQQVEQHAQTNHITNHEREIVDKKHIEAFENGDALEKIYGCTLMAFVKTDLYWFAFQIGDGKCISFHTDSYLWQEPIPWDDNCFLNKTTSICDSGAIDEFRYCYQGNNESPIAVFLGSDGMDDSFGPIENLADFYMQVCKMLAKDNYLQVTTSIEEALPALSKKGSQDDMSIAYAYDDINIALLIPKIVNYQITTIEKQIEEIEKKISSLTQTIEVLSDTTEQKDIINKEYAQKDLERHMTMLDRLQTKLKERFSEL